MAYENLLKSVEESAQEKERELRERARTAVLAVDEEAKKQARAIQQALLADAEKAATIEKNKLMYLVKAENKEHVIRIKETIFSKAFAGAEQRLSLVRNDPQYPAIFRNLTAEAVGALGGEKLKIHVDKRDEQLLKKTLYELKISGEISMDLQSAGGLVVSTPDESVKIANTVESRLERAKEQNRLEIYTALYGD